MTQKEVRFVPSFKVWCASEVLWPADRYKHVRMGIYDGFNSSDVPWGHGQVLVCGWVPVVARGQRFRGICYKTFYRYIESGFAFSMKPVVKM